MTNKNDPFVREIANSMIECIKAGTAPWQKTWEKSNCSSFPVSAITHKPYNGINALILFHAAYTNGYTDNRWVTFKQVAAKKGTIKKGSKGIKCVFYSPSKYVTYNDAGEQETKAALIMNRFVLFNVEQTEGIDWNKNEPDHHWDSDKTAESILTNSHAVINHRSQNEAYYNIDKDEIFLPNKTQFVDASSYYDTALHELGHWTGHKSRLNRKIGNSFGSEAYAKEELCAEIASMMIATTIGLPHNTENHASYCASWIKILQDDPREIFKAASAASKIKDYLIKFAENNND